jgi:hypothetical protein
MKEAMKGAMKGTWREHKVGIFLLYWLTTLFMSRPRKHSGSIRGIFREHSGNIQGAFREHSGHIEVTLNG